VARDFSVIQYWCVICCAAVILVLISSLSYRFIELPFLNLAKSKNFNRPNFIRFLSFSKFSK
jgi:peptidoglycan/LPS O-acetylase OafA/YrhL